MAEVKVILKNDSRFPTSYLRILAQYVAEMFRLRLRTYKVYVREDRGKAWRGRGGWSQSIAIARHYGRTPKFWPYAYVDRRYKGNTKQYVLNTRTELIVFLMAHEAGHGYYLGMRSFERDIPMPKPGRDEEYLCQERGMQAVEAYRRDHDKLWFRMRRALRREHAFALQKERTEQGRRDRKRRPWHKLAHATDMLKGWEGRLRYAQHKVRAYRRRVKYYESRLAALSVAPSGK